MTKRTFALGFLLAISMPIAVGLADEKNELLYVKVESENLRDAPKDQSTEISPRAPR